MVLGQAEIVIKRSPAPKRRAVSLTSLGDEKLRREEATLIRDEAARIRREQQAQFDALRTVPGGSIGTCDDETRYYLDANRNL